MKPTSAIVFLLLITSCKTIHINAWENKMECCNVYTVTKMEFGTDSIYLGVHDDTISVLHITLEQTKTNYKIDGPDYCMLYVINEKNDTIGMDAINGLPTPGKPRTYPAFGNKVWKAKPDLKKLRISLEPYCENIPFRK